MRERPIRAILWRPALIALCLVLFAAALPPLATQAADTSFPLAQARQMALSRSSELKSIANKIEIKKIRYVEAVKTVNAKMKNLRSFRWSPLLSFKFPQSPDMSQSYDFQVKPMLLQGEIDTLQHEYEDKKYDVLAKLDKAYLDAYIAQEKAAFTQERLSAAREELERNRARLLTGDASQADVDSMEASVQALREQLAQQMRNLEQAKEELASQTGFSLSGSFAFVNPLLDVDIPRAALPSLIEHTLNADHSYFVTKMASATALLNLTSYEGFMRGAYGGKMSRIDNFLSLFKQGQGSQVDTAAFKAQYDQMLADFDAPWDGSIRILFFTFTMGWFKGELSGTRYIEDDLYALYAACFEYTDALAEQKNARVALEKSVSNSYDSLINARNAYQAMASSLVTAREDLDRIIALNSIGKAEYSEVTTLRENYQTMQLDTIDMLVSYNELLTDFNRLTCGAVSPYMEGIGITTDASGGGDSYAEIDVINDPYYFITVGVQDMVFEFGLSIPEGFEPTITHYELWFEGQQVGSRTPVNATIRHLTLDYGETSLATVRLYDGDDYVDECEIDTGSLRDRLPLEGRQPDPEPEARQLGSYTTSSAITGDVSTITLNVSPLPALGAEYYSLEATGTGTLLTGEPIPVLQSFTYLSILFDSLADVQIKLYDKDKKLIYTGFFDVSNMKIIEASA